MPKQDVAFELNYDGAWRDITADDEVFTGDPIRIRRGQGDESPALRPAQINAQLVNAEDKYRTSNPIGPLYGRAGRNTPARVTHGGSTRGVVEASSWSCDQDPNFRRHPRRGRAWTDVEGGGLLQRIGQWTDPLKSAFRAYNEGLDHVIGYFPAEQPRGSAELRSTVPGTSTQGFGGGFGGFAFDSQHAPPGSAPLMDVGDGAALGIYFNQGAASAAATAGWQLSWAARHEPLGSGSLRTIMNWAALTSGWRLDLLPVTGEINLIGADNDGAWTIDSTWSTSGYDFTQWTLFSIDAQYNGGTGNTTVWVNWTNADNTVSGFMNATYSGLPGYLEWWSVLGADDELPAGSTIGHIMGVDVSSTGGVNLFSVARIYAWTGYLGERTCLRFFRLLTAAGILNYVSNGWANSMPMGAQPVATLAEHLEEIARTEDGLIYDLRVEAAVFFLCRYDRYNQTPALTLVPEDLPALPREVTDDLPIHNLVTAADRSGVEAVAEDSTGPLGTQAPPDGAGEYRQKVDVSVAAPSQRLPDIANWWMRRGTVDLPRFPQVSVNLAALSPSKVAEVEAVDVGSVIEIEGFREDTIRLFVLGYLEVIGNHSRRIVFTCAPDQQFQVAVYDDTGKRMESRTSTLNAAIDSTATSLVVTFTRIRDAWSETAEPYDWGVGGERIRVTSMGAVTGSGPWTQTATVQRSINGVRKSHTAGSPVHMFPSVQARYALGG